MVNTMQIHVVQNGDTVSSIADFYNTSIDIIIFDNQLIYPYILVIGQSLLINDGIPYPNKTYISVNGYAYPFISPWVLRETLPFLSDLSIFSYGFTSEGELIPPVLDDTWMIAEARNYRVSPILTLTPLGADGKFSNHLISLVVNNPDSVQNLINNLIYTLSEKRFEGLDIDFEYILPNDRDAFTNFIRNITNSLRPLGYQVSVALAPKTSADQQGLLYQGKDYRAIGAIVDHVLLMTYEWGYKYGPPLAVSPINLVRNVVEYAITEIPANKINLGIPNYGYDWPLPFIQDVTVAKTIGNVEAVRIAITNGSEIHFDETAQAPFFRYWQDGIEHEVWFEDVRSMRAKFNLIKEYNLRGAGYWQIMQLFRANWVLLNSMFYIV